MYVEPIAFGTVMGSSLQTLLVVSGTEEVTVPELHQPSQPATSDIDQYGSHATAVLKVTIQCFPQSDARGGGHCPKYRSRASGAEQPCSETMSAIRSCTHFSSSPCDYTRPVALLPQQSDRVHASPSTLLSPAEAHTWSRSGLGFKRLHTCSC